MLGGGLYGENLVKGIVFLSNNEGFVSLFRNFLKFNLWSEKQHLSVTLYTQAEGGGPTVTPWASERLL